MNWRLGQASASYARSLIVVFKTPKRLPSKVSVGLNFTNFFRNVIKSLKTYPSRWLFHFQLKQYISYLF
jgi:hypothetical protein